MVMMTDTKPGSIDSWVALQHQHDSTLYSTQSASNKSSDHILNVLVFFRINEVDTEYVQGSQVRNGFKKISTCNYWCLWKIWILE